VTTPQTVESDARRRRGASRLGDERRQAEAAELETRARLLGAAADRFAERGFKAVTIRKIGRAAHANIAAVNYHFGGKLGLYREVVNEAVDVMQATTDAAIRVGAGKPPDERLRAYVRVFVERVGRRGPNSWIHRLMLREVADPSPALDIIAARVIEPRLAYLREVVADLLGRESTDDVVGWCVLNVQQCLSALPPSITARTHGLPPVSGPDALSLLAEHIAEFAIGGIQEVRRVLEVRGVRAVHRVREVRKVRRVQSS